MLFPNCLTKFKSYTHIFSFYVLDLDTAVCINNI